jgi:hypothetical protein
MGFNCTICNKIYKSYQSLWNHNKNFHINNGVDNKQPVVKSDKKSECKYCSKQLADRHSKSKHEKICKKKDENILKQQIEKLTHEVEKLKKKSGSKKIINYIGSINSMNNSNNNTMNICKPGDENINLLSTDEKKYIMSQGLNSIVSLVDHLNFNEKIPEHHNFYVSAINDKHVNAIDYTTKSIVKKSKKDLFDEILFAHMNKLESINKTINYKDFNTIYDKLRAFIFLKKGKKEFFNQLNMLSYNKKNMIIKTWEKLIDDTTINPDEVSIKFQNEVKQITEQEENEQSSDDESSDDESSDDESSDDESSDDESSDEKPQLFFKKTLKSIEI